MKPFGCSLHNKYFPIFQWNNQNFGGYHGQLYQGSNTYYSNMNGRYQYQPNRFNTASNWRNHRDFGYGNNAGCYQQYRRGFYYRPTGVPNQRYPVPEKSIDKSIESKSPTSIVASNKRKSHDTNPIKSNEEVMRLKRLRKDTEDVIKDNGKKLQYKQLSLLLKKKLKNTKSQIESLPFEKTDIIQQQEVLTQERELLPQRVNDDSSLFVNGNDKSKTIWYKGDAGKWAGAPSLPDLQLGNEDFKNIGSGSLSKAHEELSVSSQENKASPEPFPHILIQSYCKLTDENPHFSKHRKALVRKTNFEINAFPRRTRRNSEPSLTNTSWSSGENSLEDLEDNSVLNGNSVNRLELGRLNTTIRRLVEDSSTTNRFRHIKTSLLKEYHSELSRQFCSERFGSEFKSDELSRITTQKSLNDETLEDGNVLQLISDQINDLDEGLDGDASFDTLPTALMSPIQTMIFAPKRERRHSFSDKNNDYNNLRDAANHKLYQCSSTTLISDTNCNEITKIKSNGQAKSLDNSCDIALNNIKSIQTENDKDSIVSLESFSSDFKVSSLWSKSKAITDVTIEETTNLQEDIINLLKESDDSRIRSKEEILLIEELKLKESRKRAIESRQKEIVEQLRKLKKMSNVITKI